MKFYDDFTEWPQFIPIHFTMVLRAAEILALRNNARLVQIQPRGYYDDYFETHSNIFCNEQAQSGTQNFYIYHEG